MKNNGGKQSNVLQCEKLSGILQRMCTVSLRGKNENKYDREERLKNCMLAWLYVFLCGPFGGLLLIKLLLHDAPS